MFNITNWRKNLKSGDKAYMIRDDSVIEIEIQSNYDTDEIQRTDEKETDMYWVNWKYYIDKTGEQSFFAGGSSACYADNMYPDYKSAYDALDKRYKDEIIRYKEELQTLKQILEYPLKSNMFFDNPALRQAYTESIEKYIN